MYILMIKGVPSRPKADSLFVLNFKNIFTTKYEQK